MKKYTIVLDNGHRINIRQVSKNSSRFKITNPDYSGNYSIYDKLFQIPNSTINGICTNIQEKLKRKIVAIE